MKSVLHRLGWLVVLVAMLAAHSLGTVYGEVKFAEKTGVTTPELTSVEGFTFVVQAFAENRLLFAKISAGKVRSSDEETFEFEVDFRVTESEQNLLKIADKLLVQVTYTRPANAESPEKVITATWDSRHPAGIRAGATSETGGDPYLAAIKPGIGYAVFFGGAVEKTSKRSDDFSPGTTAFLHFPFGKKISDGLIDWLIPNPKTTRLATSVGTPVTGRRAYVFGLTVLWGDRYSMALTTGPAFVTGANNGGNNRIGWFIGVSYTIN